ncbi:MAG: hypothetical protein WKF30_06450 [Pyrinomonadaceae bacterium]
MDSKKAQSKAGIPAKRRGQQMGDAANPDQNREAEAETPALRGRRVAENEMFADDSTQSIGANSSAPRDNTPSTPGAIPTDTPLGQSGGEKVFKQRQQKRRSS